jgi:hypothetical protein
MEPADLAGRPDPGWAVTVAAGARRERVAEALCSLADDRFGTRGAREEDGAGWVPLTLGAGVYHDADGGPTLLPGPVWTGLEVAPPDGQDRRELDLHAGVLRRTWRTRGGAILRSVRFASLARPGVVGLRAEGPLDVLRTGPALLAPGSGIDFQAGRRGDICWARTRSAGGGGGLTAAACQRSADDDRSRVVERLAVYLANPDHARVAEQQLRTMKTVGFDRLLAEHRAAWAARWADAEVTIQGDPTPNSPSGSPCSTCWPLWPTGVRRPSAPAG